MSVKENVDFIKKEIDSEETFLESFFKLEKFYKKNKKALISIVSIVVLGFIGNSIYTYMQEQSKLEANRLLNKVLYNPNDTASLEQLKTKNKTLYNLALFKKDNTASVDVEFLKELAIYNKAIKENNINELATISSNQQFILKDFAIFNQALLQAQNKDYTSARETLKLIPISSEVSKLSKILEHFLLTKVN